jgi:hypothetical protein
MKNIIILLGLFLKICFFNHYIKEMCINFNGEISTKRICVYILCVMYFILTIFKKI